MKRPGDRAVLLDSNVLIDVVGQSPGAWSQTTLARLSAGYKLIINPVVYAEVSVGFDSVELLEADLALLRIHLEQIPRPALFMAGRQFRRYRREHRGPKTSLLPDFLIGAHATVRGVPLATRDHRRYRTYFPRVTLISPETV